MDALLLITTISIMVYSYGVKGTRELRFCLNSSDFATIVNCAGFLDKTMLIKTLIDKEKSVLITAPLGCGKSTNLNMIKRFFELELDDKGAPKAIEETDNYKLFKENKLMITNDERILNGYFGKHPVIFVDYSPLRNINDFDDLLPTLILIIGRAFTEHGYLLGSGKFGLSEKAYIKVYIDALNTGLLDVIDIKTGLNRLPYYLHAHFGKKVVVLIDDYDAYLDSLLLKDGVQVEKIVAFMEQVNSNMIASNDYILFSMWTGIFRISVTSAPSQNSVHYRWLFDHAYSTYYGVTESEVDQLLTKFIANDTDRQKSKTIAKDYYNGYSILKRNTSMYTWSVLRHLKSEKETPHRRCYRTDCLKRFSRILSLPNITSYLQRIVSGGGKFLNVKDSSLTASDITALKEMKTSQPLTYRQIELFMLFLFEMGHIALATETFNYYMQAGSVKIPNLKTTLIISRVLKEVYMKQTDISQAHIDSLTNALKSLSVSESSFKDFHQSLNDLLSRVQFTVQNKNDFLFPLFVLLKTELPAVENDVRPFRPEKFAENKGETIISLINDRGVSIVIDADIVRTEDGNTLRETAATVAHKRLVDRNYVGLLYEDARNKVVYLGIGFDSGSRTVSVAYSSMINESGDLGQVAVIS